VRNGLPKVSISYTPKKNKCKTPFADGMLGALPTLVKLNDIAIRVSDKN
jgi:hypothetical protein